MIDASRVADNGLTILILLGFAYLIFFKSSPGKVKDKVKEWFKGDV